MTYFKLNIPNINNNIDRYRYYKKNILNDLSYVYRGLSYTQNSWNDTNSYSFLDKVKKDKYKLNNYFNYLDGLYTEIETFKNNIDNICYKYGYKRNFTTFKFDDNKINDCKRNLNNIIALMNNSLNYININKFGTDFENINLIYTLRNEIKNIKKLTSNLLNTIDNFTRSINNELYNSRFRLTRKKGYEFDLKVSNYNWKLNDMRVMKKDLDRTLSISNTVDNKINKNIEVNNKLSSDINNSYQNNNNIEFSKQERIKGINNNLNSYMTNNTAIDKLKEEDIKGLNNNINSISNKSTSINNIDLEDINSLTDNVNKTQAKRKDILFEIDDDFNNIKNNVTSYSSGDNNINYKYNKDLNNLTNNINNYDTKTTNIDFKDNSTFNLNDNVDIKEDDTKINLGNIKNSSIKVDSYKTTETKIGDFVGHS